VLGRGSLATIQKHLNTLRADLEPKTPEISGEIPRTPPELADAIWRASWTAAQASTAQALATALLERDKARHELAATAADLDAVTADADEAMASAAASEATAAEAVQMQKAREHDLDEVTAAATAAAAAAERKLEETLKNSESLIQGLTSAHKLEIAHTATTVATLQGVIDRLSGQLAEVKSMLPRHNATN
jgi:chromosome segregation ATPase